MVELQPLQAGLDAVEDVAARVAAGIGPGAGRPEHFCRHDDAIAWHLQIFQGLAGDFLGAPLGIDVGGVDKVDAGVHGLADQAIRIVLLQRTDLAPDPAVPTEGHGAEA